MKKIISFLVLVFFAAAATAQQVPVNVGTAPNNGTGDQARTAYTKLNTNDAQLFTLFPGAVGVVKANGGFNPFTIATAADIVGLFSTCSGSQYLGADGACHNASGAGTVTSVGLTGFAGLTVGGSPITTSGSFTLSTTLSGLLKGTGSAFTTGTSADVLALWSGTCSSSTFLRGDGACAAAGGSGLTSVGISTTAAWLTVGNTPLTSNGTITVNPSAGQTGNMFIASPNGITGAVGLRAIVGADLPAINLGISGAGGVTGNLLVTNLNNGTGATSSTFFRGDGTWATPAGGGNVSNSGTPTNGQLALWTGSTVVQGVTALPAANEPAHTGDVTNSAASLAMTVKGANGVLYSSLSTGILKNTTTTGVPSIAVLADILGLYTGTCNSSTFVNGAGACATPSGGGNLSNSGTPTAHQTAVFVTSTTVAGVGPGTTGQVWTSGGASADPGFSSTPTLTGTNITGIPTTGLTGALQAAQEPAHTGDMTNTAGSLATVVGKINGGIVPASAALMGTNSSSQPIALSVGNGLAITGTVVAPAAPLNPQVGTTYTVSCTTDAATLITLSNAASIAVTVPQATGTCGANFGFEVQNKGVGVATLTPTTSTINGLTSLAIPSGKGCSVTSDGTNYQVSACTAISDGTTKFTIAGTGCTIGTTTGSATGGTFQLAAGPCTSVVITMNGAVGLAAQTGYHCNFGDRTAQTAGTFIPAWYENSSTTLTATAPIPAAAGATDVVAFTCGRF